MIKKAVSSLVALVVVTALSCAVLIAAPSFAFDGTVSSGADAARGNGQTANLVGNDGVFQTITSVLLYILGAVSVIMIIIGGLRYVVSGGNASNVTAAKNTILYAIVGIIIALLSYAIIKFVLGTFTTDGTGGGTNV